MASDDIYQYSPREGEREKRREKKSRPKMRISGRSVVELARIISKRAANFGKPSTGVRARSQKKRRRRKK